MQRVSVENVLRANGYSIKFSTGMASTITGKGKEYHIPGDGLLSHVNLTWFTAQKLKINPHLVAWPQSASQCKNGELAKVFGETEDYVGDMTALERYLREQTPEFTSKCWEGVYQTSMAQLFDDDGEVKKLTPPYYVNALLPTSVAKVIKQTNEKLVITEADKGSVRLVGGEYPHAAKGFTPPLHISDLSEIQLEMKDPGLSQPSNVAHSEPEATPSTSELRSIAGLTGERLREKLRGSILTTLSARAPITLRKQKLKKFTCFASDLEVVDIKDVLNEAINLGAGKVPLTAYLLRQVEQKFAVDYDNNSAVNRVRLMADEEEQSN